MQYGQSGQSAHHSSSSASPDKCTSGTSVTRKEGDTHPTFLTMMKAKIHRAIVTQADMNYEGSIAIDRVLLDQAGILPYEQVHVYDINNGERFITYAIEAPPESGTICVNGAAARLVMPGDRVIIVAYSQVSESAVAKHSPKVVLIRDDNRPA